MRSPITILFTIILFGSALSSSAMNIPSGRNIMVIAHRGASGYAPENTMAAFRLAYEMGADMIELDVYRTSDGAIVVMHDDTVDRTTDGTGKITDMTLEHVRKLDAGIKMSEKYAGERVPTLDEVLTWASDHILINIEIKGPDCEKSIADLIVKYNMLDKVIVSSFHHEYLVRLHEINQRILLGVLIRDIFEIDIDALLASCPYNALHPRYLKITKSQIMDAHKRGLKVNAYTVNDTVSMHQLISFKTDGIITNYPDTLIKLLKKTKQKAKKTEDTTSKNP